MTALEINKETYYIKSTWSELRIVDAIALNTICFSMPPIQKEYYDLLFANDNEELNTFIYTKGLTDEQYAECHTFKVDCIASLSDIPKDVLLKVNAIELSNMFEQLAERFVIGVFIAPIDYKPKIREDFIWNGNRFILPKREEHFGVVKPFFDRTAIEFCEIADMISAGVGTEGGKWTYATNILSILLKLGSQENLPYNEKNSMDMAPLFETMPMDLVFDCYASISEVNNYISQYHYTLFEKAGKGNKAYKSSGLQNYGWYASLVRCANSLSELEQVEQMDFHKWITYLAIKTAETKLQIQ